MGKIIDLTGQKFGRLTVEYKAGKDSRGESIWHCVCECGNTKDVLSSNLRKGATRSCGCLQKERAGKKTPIKDLTNQKFGKLTAIKPTEKRLNGQVIWLCQCECGKEIEVRSYNLVSGITCSCGCLNQSHGELVIENLLKEYNIFYKKEAIFSTCKFEDTKQYARFDFFVDNSYIIEFDGEQHFTYSNNGWNTKDNFITTKTHDNYKNKWCKENHIPIIRIPYTHLDKIEIEDLLLESSVFKLEE